METKEEIRERALKSRAEIEKADRRAAERVILERLVQENFYADAGIIEESLKQGKRVAAPRVVGRRRMEFFFIKSRADLRPGAWNIPEPGPWCAKAPLPDEKSLVILPGAAFDRSGARIGYGRGFYDAYLKGNDRCRKAALAFDVQCVDKIPAEAHDIRADYIITEKELIICSQDYPETR